MHGFPCSVSEAQPADAGDAGFPRACARADTSTPFVAAWQAGLVRGVRMRASVTEHNDQHQGPPGGRAPGTRNLLRMTHLPWKSTWAPERHGAAQAWIRWRRLVDMDLVENGLQPCAGVRTTAQIRGTDGEYIAVMFNLGGREIVEQDGREVDLHPGEATIMDSTRPARFTVVEPMRTRTLFVPRDVAAEVCPDVGHAAATALARRGPAIRLLGDYLGSLFAVLPDLDPAALAPVRAATMELLAAALQPSHPAAPAAREGVWAVATGHIERHLGDHRLTPSAVAEAVGTSLRTLQVAFAERDTSVAAFIRERRLARCHADLTRRDDLSVTEVAFRWGFTDSSHFSRAFKRRYGCAPREAREAARSVR